MKIRSLSVLFSLLFVAGSSALAQRANLVSNGDFEAGPSGAETYNFESTPGWYNWGQGLNQRTNARSNVSASRGSRYSAVISDRYNIDLGSELFARDQFGSVVHSQRTGHVIRTGDSFQLSYDWTTGYRWDGLRGQVRFVLFATDNDALGGSVVWSEVFDSGRHGGREGDWRDVTLSGQPVPAAAAGRTLFVAFYGFLDAAALRNHPGYARVDNIVVTVR